MSDLAHSPLGPSSAERWINCPASVKLTELMPDTQSQYAAEGTAAHEIAELCALNNVMPEIMLGRKVQVGEYEIEVDQDMVAGVRMFLEHMNDLPPGTDFNESRVHYEKYVKDGFGTLDRARFANGTVYIRDFKYGKGVRVEAKSNPQLKLYALGFMEEFGWMLPEIERFNLGIVQPRLDHIDEVEISVDDLIKWVEEVVVPAAKATEVLKTAKIKAGSWCQFCKIKATCMVRASSVFNEVVNDFENLDAAIDEAGKLPLDPEKQRAVFGAVYMSPEQVGKALHVLPQIKAWCKDLENYAMKEVQQGHEVGGWFLTEGRGGNRTWALAEKDLLNEARAQGLPDLRVLYEEPKLKSPPALEKAIGKKHPLLTKEGVVIKPAGKPVLAPPGDSRPPLKVDALKEFSDLGNDE